MSLQRPVRRRGSRHDGGAAGIAIASAGHAALFFLAAILCSRGPQLLNTHLPEGRPGLRSLLTAGVSLAVAATGRPKTYLPVPFDPAEYRRCLEDGGDERTLEFEHAADRGGLVQLADWLDCSDAPRPVDDVVVLPGDDPRGHVAAALVRAGFGERILFPRPASAENYDFQSTRRILQEQGLESDVLQLTVDSSDGTIGDARAVAAMLGDDPGRRVAVVTSFYHVRRARIAFRSVFGSRADTFCYLGVPATCVAAENWWQSDHGTQAIVLEYVKLTGYWLIYGDGRWAVPLALAGLFGLWRGRRTLGRMLAAGWVQMTAALRPA